MTRISPLTTIYTAPLPADSPRGERHAAERRAVESIVKSVFGPDAVYAHRPDGAPLVEGTAEAISVSHGAGRAVLAVSCAKSVGVDIEQWRDQLLRVKSRFLSAEEQAMTPDSESLLLAWTAKEATFKAAGIEGLTLADIRLHSLRRASVDAPDGTTRHFRITHIEEFPVDIAVAEPIVPEKE